MQSLVRWNRKVFCFLALLLAVPFPALAQKAVVEESVTEINCDSRTHAVMRFRQVTTILNAQRASLASFGGNDRLTSVGQLAHVILEVPLLGDTLWLECSPPPAGYVHEDIAGHNAVEIGPKGGIRQGR